MTDHVYASQQTVYLSILADKEAEIAELQAAKAALVVELRAARNRLRDFGCVDFKRLDAAIDKATKGGGDE